LTAQEINCLLIVILIQSRLKLSLYLRMELLLLTLVVGKLFRAEKLGASLHSQDLLLDPLMLSLARPKKLLIWLTGSVTLSPPSPVSHTTSTPAPNDLAGFRIDKGKSLVVSGALGHSTSCSIGMPPGRRAQQRTGGCLPTPFIHEDLLLECERAQQPSETTLGSKPHEEE
jgi:hypothetical protein